MEMSEEKKRVMREQGARVRAARTQKRGLTLAKLGELLGVSEHTAWRIEHGDRPLSLHEAELIAGATGVPVAFLIAKWTPPTVEEGSREEGSLEQELRRLRKELDALAALVDRSNELYEGRFAEMSNEIRTRLAELSTEIQKRFAELAQRERDQGQAPPGAGDRKRRRGDRNS